MFYDILQGLCREHNLTVSAALKMMGISCGNMASWKKGRMPQSRTLRRVAQFFDVPVDFLIGDKKKLYAAQQEQLLALFSSVPEASREAVLKSFGQSISNLQKE